MRVPLLLLAVAMAGACAGRAPPAPVAASIPADAAALLAQMRSACGGDAWDRVEGWHETGRVDLPGRPGVPYEAWHDLRTPTSLIQNRIGGQIVRQAGYDGRVRWQRGADGSVQLISDAAELRRHRRDAWLSNHGWMLPGRLPARFSLAGTRTRDGRTYDVLRATPEGADSADLWVDRETRHVARLEAGGEYAELGDYRSFSGICSATTGRQGDGDPAHDLVLHVETVETGPVDAALFAPPGGGEP